MELKPFKQDIDELISEFAEGRSTTLVELKRIWLSKKFTYICEASPTTNQGYFMQSIYGHSIGYMTNSSSSFSHRLGGLYCLYCLYETQPFKPPFKIYISPEELKHLRGLVQDAKEKGVKVACALVKRMMDGNFFLYGFVSVNHGYITERADPFTDDQKKQIHLLYKKLFADKRIERFINMDMGAELGVDLIKKMATDYAVAKDQAITGAQKLVDVENIKHIADGRLVGDAMEKIVEAWNIQKQQFYEQTGYRPSPDADDSSKRQKLTDNGVFQGDDDSKKDEEEHDAEIANEIEQLIQQPDLFNNLAKIHPPGK